MTMRDCGGCEGTGVVTVAAGTTLDGRVAGTQDETCAQCNGRGVLDARRRPRATSRATVTPAVETVTAAALQLGDIVALFDGPYSDGTVKNITADTVTFFRPYVQTADFSHTGGVICYIGVEEFSVSRVSTARYPLRRRGAALR